MSSTKTLLGLPDGIDDHDEEEEEEEEYAEDGAPDEYEEEEEEEDETTAAPAAEEEEVEELKEGGACVEDADPQVTHILHEAENEDLRQILIPSSQLNSQPSLHLPVMATTEHSFRVRQQILSVSLGDNYKQYRAALLSDKEPSLSVIIDADDIHAIFVRCNSHIHEKLILRIDMLDMRADYFPPGTSYVIQLESTECVSLGSKETYTKKWFLNQHKQTHFAGTQRKPQNIQGLMWRGTTCNRTDRARLYTAKPLTCILTLEWYRSILRGFLDAAKAVPDHPGFVLIPYPHALPQRHANEEQKHQWDSLVAYYVSQNKDRLFGEERDDAHTLMYNDRPYFRLRADRYNALLQELQQEHSHGHDVLHSSRLLLPKDQISRHWKLTITPLDRAAYNVGIQPRTNHSSWNLTPLYFEMKLLVSFVIL